MQDKCAAGLLCKYNDNLNSIKSPNTYSIYKITCHRCENLNKKAFLKGFFQLIPFCKTVTQMNGLNMM